MSTSNINASLDEVEEKWRSLKEERWNSFFTEKSQQKSPSSSYDLETLVRDSNSSLVDDTHSDPISDSSDSMLFAIEFDNPLSQEIEVSLRSNLREILWDLEYAKFFVHKDKFKIHEGEFNKELERLLKFTTEDKIMQYVKMLLELTPAVRQEIETNYEIFPQLVLNYCKSKSQRQFDINRNLVKLAWEELLNSDISRTKLITYVNKIILEANIDSKNT